MSNIITDMGIGIPTGLKPSDKKILVDAANNGEANNDSIRDSMVSTLNNKFKTNLSSTTWNNIISAIGNITLGNASPEDVLKDKTFSNQNGLNQKGIATIESVGGLDPEHIQNYTVNNYFKIKNQEDTNNYGERPVCNDDYILTWFYNYVNLYDKDVNLICTVRSDDNEMINGFALGKDGFFIECTSTIIKYDYTGIKKWTYTKEYEAPGFTGADNFESYNDNMYFNRHSNTAPKSENMLYYDIDTGNIYYIFQFNYNDGSHSAGWASAIMIKYFKENNLSSTILLKTFKLIDYDILYDFNYKIGYLASPYAESSGGIDFIKNDGNIIHLYDAIVYGAKMFKKGSDIYIILFVGTDNTLNKIYIYKNGVRIINNIVIKAAIDDLDLYYTSILNYNDSIYIVSASYDYSDIVFLYRLDILNDTGLFNITQYSIYNALYNYNNNSIFSSLGPFCITNNGNVIMDKKLYSFKSEVSSVQ